MANDFSARISVSGITDHDAFIIAKSLAYAINTIDSLPEIRREGSDRDDMQRLLDAMCPNHFEREEMMRSARMRMGLELSPSIPLDPLGDTHSMHRDIDPAMIDQYWKNGMLTVAATVSDGYYAGATFISIIERDQVQDIAREIAGWSRQMRRRWIRSIVTAIRAAVSHYVPGEGHPFANGHWLYDVALLFAAKVAAGGDNAVLRGSGLSSVILAIDPDLPKDWRIGGRLDPDFAAEFGLDETPYDLRGSMH